MKCCLIIGVGKHDVCLEGKNAVSPYLQGKKIWEDWERHKEDVSLPLIGPALTELKKIIKYQIKPTGKLKDLNKIYLIATHQKKEGFKSKDKDTIWFAYIIKNLLETKWKISSTKIEMILLDDLEIPPIVKKIRKLEQAIHQSEHIFLKLEGTLPVLNFLLAARLILNFHDKVKIIRVSDKAVATKDYAFVEYILRAKKLQST